MHPACPQLDSPEDSGEFDLNLTVMELAALTHWADGWMKEGEANQTQPEYLTVFANSNLPRV